MPRAIQHMQEQNGVTIPRKYNADPAAFCAVYINGSLTGEGEGRTKKEAEQAAAGAALRRLQP